MIHSIFIISVAGDVVIEKHYRKPLSRLTLDAFFEAQRKNPLEVPPVLSDSKNYLISVKHDQLYFVAVCQSEVPPLSILEVLHRVVDTFKVYFNHVTERRLATDAVTVYLLLDEMIDNGFPLSTEINLLREMIQPPSLTSSIMNELTGKKRVKETLASGMLTNTIWRKADVRYTNNECFVDCKEQVDAIVTRQGMPVTTDIKGVIMCKCKLSGMPDLLLSFINPRVIEEVNLHPCVRIARWTNERVMSFVPPDGEFKLAEYSVGQGNIPLPVEVRSAVNYVPTGPGRVEILCNSKTASNLPITDCKILMQFPKCVNSVSVTPSVGNVSFDSVTKLLTWDVRTLAPAARASLRGSVMLQSGEHIPDGAPSAQVKFRCAGMTASSLKVNRLDVFGEKYKPFKGVKYMTQAGNFQVRS